MTEDQLRETQERAHLIRDLTTDHRWTYLHDYVSDMINKKNRSLLNGNAKTIEDYRAEAGWISGALFVLHAADHLDKQLENAHLLVQEAKAMA